MDPINIPQMLAYIPYMDPMGYGYIGDSSCDLLVEIIQWKLDLFRSDITGATTHPSRSAT